MTFEFSPANVKHDKLATRVLHVAKPGTGKFLI